jgi:uncharacterized membrane protein
MGETYQASFTEIMGRQRMRVIIWVVGLLWIALGIWAIIRPEGIKKGIQKYFAGKNPRFLSIIPLLFGILLLAASFKANARWYVFILGVGLCLKGVFWLTRPQTTQKMINWWANVNVRSYQI